jgi:hypothetical protein
LVSSIEKNFASSEIEPGGVVIFDNDLSIKNQKKLLKQDDLFNYLEQDKTCYCYSGEHRRRALITLKEVTNRLFLCYLITNLFYQKFPNSKRFNTFNVIVCIVPNEEAMEKHLYTLGLGLNQLGMIRKEVDWIDRILHMNSKFHKLVNLI